MPQHWGARSSWKNWRLVTGGTPPTLSQTQTALVNEVWRDMLNTIKVDNENANWIICEQVIPEDVGGWTIREVCLYDQDGDLIAVGNFPETYKPTLQQGSGRTQTIQVILQVSASSSVELKIDPSVVLATREYVDDQDKKHEDKVDPHPQYVLKGNVQYERYNANRDYTRGEIVSILDNSEVTNYWCNKTHQPDSPVNPIGDSSDTWREFLIDYRWERYTKLSYFLMED
ncbi:phage tail protein [Vibrio sp. PP-XX7]